MADRSVTASTIAEPSGATGLTRYGQLAQAWRERIVSGEWVAGSAIPSEGELARGAGVALGTVRQALAVLVAQGLLERLHGRGTFVTSGLAGASMLRFFRFGSTTNASASAAPRSRILARRVSTASAEQRRRLGLGGADAPLRLLELRRLRLADERPLLVEALWLPLPAFEPLAALPLAEWDDLLYPMYSRRCGVTIVRAADELSFTTLDAATARDLELDEGAAGVRVEREAFDLAGRCVELRETLGDARAFRYRAEIR